MERRSDTPRRARARMDRIALVTLTCALSPLACRGILGIDEDVPLLPPAEDGGARDAPTSADDGPATDGASDASPGFDPTFDAGSTTVDRRYAVWPLPAVKPLLSNYDLTADTVTDKTTGLVWQRNDSTPPTMSYGAGVAYCAGLTLGGESDWRLPTRIEALTTLDYGQTAGLLSKTVFPDGAQPAAPSEQWTDSISLLGGKLDDRFVIDVLLGNVDIAGNAQISDLVRCVRGGPTTSPINRYEVVGGVARDVRTGVVWQVVPLAATMLLADAKLACEALSIAGVGGFRLPSVRELASLVDEARDVAPLVPAIFSPGPTSRFWSATTRANPATTNGAVDFATANIHQEDFATQKLSVRCVR